MPSSARTPLTQLTSQVYEIPTDQLEADGTLEWASTTLVMAEVRAAGVTGIGWTYASKACQSVMDDQLQDAVVGRDLNGIAGTHEAMVRACRNLGRPGIVSCAISAVDIALWDCKARSLGIALADLLGRCQVDAPIYGSGGFTNYDEATAQRQLERWIGEWRIPRVKIKIGESWGTNEKRDVERTTFARRVIGDQAALFVDANGAYTRKQGVRMGRQLADCAAIAWFEEPVSSDDLSGLREIRGRVGVDIAAGEYGYDEAYFAKMVAADAVDCLQIDVTRCGGYTSWLRAAAMAGAQGLDVSAHCAPNLHAHVGVAVPNLRHIEYFHDHSRLETILFDGVLDPTGGALCPRADTPGHGMTLKAIDAEPYRA